jgi:hypothetical protein
MEHDPSPYRWVTAIQVGLPWIAFGLVFLFPRFLSDCGWADKHMILLLLLSKQTIVAYNFVAMERETLALLAACLTGVILCAPLVLSDRDLFVRRNRIVLVLLLGFSIFYSHVAVTELNCVLDKSHGAVHRSVVLKKSIAFSRFRYHQLLYLRIAPWEANGQPGGAFVPKTLWDAVNAGDAICVVQREGWLGLGWYTIKSCQRSGQPFPLGQVGGVQ